jgi:hypothetical protein
MGGAFQG